VSSRLGKLRRALARWIRPEPDPRARSRGFAADYLAHNIPKRLGGQSLRAFRVQVRNTGSEPWQRNPADGHFVALAVYVDDEPDARGLGILLRDTVLPGESTVIPFQLRLPAGPCELRLKLDLFAHNVTMLSHVGSGPLRVSIDVTAREETESERLWQLAERRDYWFFSPGLGVHLHGDEPCYPLFARSARGCRIRDVAGREYLDLMMGWGSALLGYAHEATQEAIRHAASSAAVITLTHELEIEVADRIASLIPSAEMALFGKNGSDACTAAVRVARAHTGRRTLLVCGYHGWQDWFAGPQKGFLASGVPEREPPLVIPFPERDLPALERLLAQHEGDVAAVMLEPAAPVLRLDAPIYDADAAYLGEVARLTRSKGALLIFDEVMSGFRYRAGSVQAATGVIPDLTCLGKALSGGMPLSALVGRGELIRRALHRIAYSPTFKGEVYSFAAAAAALRVYESGQVPRHVERVGALLMQRTDAALKRAGLLAHAVGVPFRMTVSFDDEDPERRILMRTLWVQELARRGILTWKGLAIPSLAHDDAELEVLGRAFEESAVLVADALERGTLLQSLVLPDDI
jgi:glutamate-1-semialdehyde 2,1-aminomutase